ncbi:MAG TPA: 2-phospho-L-lactate guanylyltransferase [Ramlibacter sp.]|nr:2-phospho-L-lactate guanylyltransferase [Ramlibacter sp.]
MSHPTLWAVVPVKAFAFAKQRLAPVLAAHERAALARAMFADVLQALARNPFLAGALVVTQDAEAAAMARGAGAGVLSDPPESGLTPALSYAARTLAGARRAGMLVVPADLPLITCADIELIALGHRSSPAVTLVAAGSDGGTNALACSPPDAMPFFFGENSFRRHLDCARTLGLAPRVLTLPRFGRDIDRPDDLLAFLERPSATRTHAFLLASGIAQRLRSPQTAEPARSREFTGGKAAQLHPKG